ncbi:acyl-CoA dehydrogenase [Halosolutus gelatinilyticus]|uniref:acyl-CoA dehydrogenase n=1 Tax=Halosolutus gelatinilyticus TaxID=2931975 RepID=UPI001FF1D024|nr:acyl-CoA dehydrogenase [Halosolutus gelatinilyticus]
MGLKGGSGDLDFGNKDGSTDESEPKTTDAPSETDTDRSPTAPDPTPDDRAADRDESETDENEFPYFVRRSNVGDERDERIEVHLRKTVLGQESSFRSDLADELGEDGEISKTDAREFALKYAFENPAGVAELMREEGYGLTD